MFPTWGPGTSGGLQKAFTPLLHAHMNVQKERGDILKNASPLRRVAKWKKEEHVQQSILAEALMEVGVMAGRDILYIGPT